MVRWTNRAARDLASLPEKIQPRVKQIVADVDSNKAHGKKLKGKLKGKLSIRLGRSHRIMYTFDGSDVVVLLVQPRKDVYR